MAIAVAAHIDVSQLRPALKASGLTQREVAKRLTAAGHTASYQDVCKLLRATDRGGLVEALAAAIFDATAEAGRHQE